MRFGVPALRLRPADLNDAERVFEWRNRPEIVALSSSRRPVSWGEHQAWFGDAVRDENRRVFIVLRDDTPIGQVRFDRLGAEECEVSIYLLAEHTGRGLGTMALRIGCRTIFRTWPVARIVAFVRRENVRSLQAFGKAGFFEAPAPTPRTRPGHAVLHRDRTTEDGSAEVGEACR